MEFHYKNKTYEIVKAKDSWRVYSSEPSFTKEEGLEVLQAIKALEGKSRPNYEYYLILGGTLWRVSEQNKTYETYDAKNDTWDDMKWLKDKLTHEVECAKHLGERFSEPDALELCKQLRKDYVERNEKARN